MGARPRATRGLRTATSMRHARRASRASARAVASSRALYPARGLSIHVSGPILPNPIPRAPTITSFRAIARNYLSFSTCQRHPSPSTGKGLTIARLFYIAYEVGSEVFLREGGKRGWGLRGLLLILSSSGRAPLPQLPLPRCRPLWL